MTRTNAPGKTLFNEFQPFFSYSGETGITGQQNTCTQRALTSVYHYKTCLSTNRNRNPYSDHPVGPEANHNSFHFRTRDLQGLPPSLQSSELVTPWCKRWQEIPCQSGKLDLGLWSNFEVGETRAHDMGVVYISRETLAAQARRSCSHIRLLAPLQHRRIIICTADIRSFKSKQCHSSTFAWPARTEPAKAHTTL